MSGSRDGMAGGKVAKSSYFGNYCSGMGLRDSQVPHSLHQSYSAGLRCQVNTSQALLGVDLMEVGDDYTVHEVNSTCEWKGLNQAVPDVDVPARIADWLEVRAGE